MSASAFGGDRGLLPLVKSWGLPLRPHSPAFPGLRAAPDISQALAPYFCLNHPKALGLGSPSSECGGIGRTPCGAI